MKFKQDYLIKRALQRKIEVRGNPRTYKALKDSLAAVLEELKRMSAVSEENSGLLALIDQINVTISGFGQYGCTFGFTMRHIGNISVYKGCTMAYIVQSWYAAVHLWKARQAAWLCGMYACTPKAVKFSL